MKVSLIKIVLTFISLFSLSVFSQTTYEVKNILIVPIHSTINPGTLNVIQEALKIITPKAGGLLILKLNTPGGGLMTTKEIQALLGESSIPHIAWITPEGGSATSAGALIANSTNLIFMSEGTNIGAATPVEMGGDLGQDLRLKTINDLAAQAKALALVHGRNADEFIAMIEKAKSFNHDEAFKLKIAQGIANDFLQLKKQLNGLTVTIKGVPQILFISPSSIVQEYQIDLGQQILNVLGHPQVAYFLLLCGIMLIYFEMQTPGGFIAGSLGVMALILASVGMQILPIHWGALSLLIASGVFFILEIYITSFGLLSLLGMSSFVTGSLFLFRSQDGYVELKSSMIYTTAGSLALFLGFVTIYMLRNKVKKENFFSPLGKIGYVINCHPHGLYQIKIGGEIWNAYSETGKLNLEDEVIVSEHPHNSLTLKIQKRG